jgi:hypothetical protein
MSLLLKFKKVVINTNLCIVKKKYFLLKLIMPKTHQLENISPSSVDTTEISQIIPRLQDLIVAFRARLDRAQTILFSQEFNINKQFEEAKELGFTEEESKSLIKMKKDEILESYINIFSPVVDYLDNFTVNIIQVIREHREGKIVLSNDEISNMLATAEMMEPLFEGFNCIFLTDLQRNPDIIGVNRPQGNYGTRSAKDPSEGLVIKFSSKKSNTDFRIDIIARPEESIPTPDELKNNPNIRRAQARISVTVKHNRLGEVSVRVDLVNKGGQSQAELDFIYPGVYDIMGTKNNTGNENPDLVERLNRGVDTDSITGQPQKNRTYAHHYRLREIDKDKFSELTQFIQELLILQ